MSYIAPVDWITENGIVLLNHNMSWLELAATILGIWATILSARRNVYTWLVNLAGVVLFAVIFYRLRLYADLLLQIYYFTLGILGWLWWSKKAKNHHVPVGYWKPGTAGYIIALVGLAVASAIMGYVVAHFHIWMPRLFPQEAFMPYANATILVMSITGTFLMSRRKIENWWLWAVSNPLAVWIYWQQGSILLAFIFLIFWIIGLTGWYNWQKEYREGLSDML